MNEGTLDAVLCQYMLTEHGRFPHEVINLSRREKMIVFEILKKHGKELDKIRNKK